MSRRPQILFGILAAAAVFAGAGVAFAKLYVPASESLLNGTLSVSGTVSDLATDNSVYRIIRGYGSTFGADQRSASTTQQLTGTGISTAYVDSATLTWTVPVADKYLVYATSKIKRPNTTAVETTKAQMTIDATSYGESFVAHSTDVSSYTTSQQQKLLSLTAASHTVKTQYGITDTAAFPFNAPLIKNSHIVAFRVGNNVKTAEPAGSTTTSTSYTDIATLTFTPDVAVDWIVFGHGELNNATAANQSGALFEVDGTTAGEHIQTQSLTGHYLGFTFAKKVSLTANASHTFKIKVKSTSGTTVTYRNLTLYAIPATLFNEVQQTVADTEVTCSTCVSATPTDMATLTFTPATSGDYMILATGAFNTQSTTVYVGSRLTVDGTLYDEDLTQTANTAAYPTFALMAIPNLSAASHTLKLRLFNQTTGTTVKMKWARIIAIRMPPANFQKVEAEYSGTANTLNWTQGVWTVNANINATSVPMTYQLFDYNASAYPSSGNGYISFISSGTAGTDQTQTQTITVNPQNFRDGSGTWKMKVTATATSTDWVDWKGDLVSFNPTGTLSTDIVDSGGASVSSPSVSLGAVAAGFSCTTSTGTLGTASQKLRVINVTDTPTWTLSMAASAPTATWVDASTHKFDFNDATGSGCTDGGDTDTVGGQMTLDPSVSTVTAVGSGCTTTGVSKGASTAYVEGTTNSVTLMNASASADFSCIWDMTGVGVSQKIPAEQVAGTYTINMTISVVAS